MTLIIDLKTFLLSNCSWEQNVVMCLVKLSPLFTYLNRLYKCATDSKKRPHTCFNDSVGVNFSHFNILYKLSTLVSSVHAVFLETNVFVEELV